MEQSLLEATGFRKSFGGVFALRDGRFTLRPGSVHALCGGNGAGKSTFLKILMGIHRRDAGTLLRSDFFPGLGWMLTVREPAFRPPR